MTRFKLRTKPFQPMPLETFLSSSSFSLPAAAKAAGFNTENALRNWKARSLVKFPDTTPGRQQSFLIGDIVLLAIALRLSAYGVDVAKAYQVACDHWRDRRDDMKDLRLALHRGGGVTIFPHGTSGPADATDHFLTVRTEVIRQRVIANLREIWKRSPYFDRESDIITGSQTPRDAG